MWLACLHDVEEAKSIQEGIHLGGSRFKLLGIHGISGV